MINLIDIWHNHTHNEDIRSYGHKDTHIHWYIHLCFVLLTVTINNISEMREHDIHRLFCKPIRIWKDLSINFLNHVNTWFSSSVNKYKNFPSWFNSAKCSYWLYILLNRPWRMSELHLHSIIKWHSSSTFTYKAQPFTSWDFWSPVSTSLSI